MGIIWNSHSFIIRYLAECSLFAPSEDDIREFLVEKMVPELLQWQLERKSCIAVKSVTKASSSHPIAPKHVVGVDAASFLRDCITCLKTITPCSEVRSVHYIKFNESIEKCPMHWHFRHKLPKVQRDITKVTTQCHNSLQTTSSTIPFLYVISIYLLVAELLCIINYFKVFTMLNPDVCKQTGERYFALNLQLLLPRMTSAGKIYQKGEVEYSLVRGTSINFFDVKFCRW